MANVLCCRCKSDPVIIIGRNGTIGVVGLWDRESLSIDGNVDIATVAVLKCLSIIAVGTAIL